LTSDHTPLLIDIALKICHNVEIKDVRDWSAYSKERLLDLLSKERWDTDCCDVQDFNNVGSEGFVSIQGNELFRTYMLSDMKRKRKN
jgi:hypothetical protein